MTFQRYLMAFPDDARAATMNFRSRFKACNQRQSNLSVVHEAGKTTLCERLCNFQLANTEVLFPRILYYSWILLVCFTTDFGSRRVCLGWWTRGRAYEWKTKMSWTACPWRKFLWCYRGKRPWGTRVVIGVVLLCIVWYFCRAVDNGIFTVQPSPSSFPIKSRNSHFTGQVDASVYKMKDRVAGK